MALTDFTATLDALLSDAEIRFDAATSDDELDAARVEFLGAKQGKLKATQKQMGSVDKEDRPAAGKKFNEVKTAVDAAFQSAQTRLSSATSVDSSPKFDVTVPGIPVSMGRLHPITQTIEELKDIMGRLGFTVVEGPEIEDDWHNFEALNIAPEHPARDPLDNFYLEVAAGMSNEPRLLRSQTSTVQIRVMEKTKPPVRIISLGRVYRPDDVDATHYPMFHQIEGLMIDEQVTMSDLKSVLRLFATSYLGGDVHVRFRPSFFPFTEPSVEADYYWDGRWVEFGGAGMVDPAVLASVGYDPEEVSGFAFGLGIERLCMMRHNIKDIRNLFNNDVRFLSQF
jgi:phenylalanyl-tRNA synthetase alpha chain